MRTSLLAAALVLSTAITSAGAAAPPRDPQPATPRLRCGTTAWLHASTMSALGATGGGDRPALPDVVDSATRPLRVHYDGAVVPAERAELAVAAAEAAWASQVDGAGFPAPLADDRGFDDDGGDDRLDIYLSPAGPGIGALTISGDDVDPRDGRAARAAFVRVDPGVDDDVLVVTIHHEFQHAVQFAVDALESPMWFESTAVAWELRARPEVDAWQDALPSFQRQPQAPLSTDALAFAPFATDDGALYEYGAALFALYVDEVVGDGDGALLRALWESSAQEQPDNDNDNDDDDDDASGPNEPDWLDGLRVRIGGEQALRDLLLDFAAWRSLTGPRSVVDDGPPAGWGLDGRAALGVRALRLDALPGVARTTTPAEGPFPLGCATFGGSAALDVGAPLRIEAASPAGHPLAIVAVVVDGAGVSRAATRHRSPVGVEVALDVDVGRGADVVLAVCDVANVDADAPPAFAPVTLRIARRDAPPGGEGEGEGVGETQRDPPADGCDDDAAAADCGCACEHVPAPSSSSPSGNPQTMRRSMGTVGFLFGAFAFALRGWRVWRRRRLYRERSSGR